jgi:hypothetical protein
MTATQEKWAERIAAWRESGLTSEKFCEGREFSANGLRLWAYKLGQTKRRQRRPKVPIARVVRAPAPKEPTGNTPEPVDSPIAVELGGARLVVRRGFDRATLAALMDVLAERGGAR